jgi:hypothetical protein
VILTMGCMVWGLIPGEGRFSGPIQSRPKAHPASCKVDTGSLSWGLSRQGMVMTTHPLLALGSGVGKSIPLFSHYACLACNGTVFTAVIVKMRHAYL